MWLGDTAWSKPALVIMRVWQMGGYYMIMFLAGLQTIPETLYEAAELDGRQRNPEVFPHHIAAFVEHNVCCHDSSGNRSVQYVRIHLYYDSRRSFGLDQYHDVLHLRTSLQ